MPESPPGLCSKRGCNARTQGRFCVECKKLYDQKRFKRYNKKRDPEKQKFYKTDKWETDRKRQLKKHPWCQWAMPDGTECGDIGVEVDHIIPREQGGADEESNYQTLCTKHHAKKTSMESGFARANSKCEVILVAGPPCAGKSTYISEYMDKGDLVVDLDRISHALSMVPMHSTVPHELMQYVWCVRDAIYRKLTMPHGVRRVWVVECAADAKYRHQLAKKIGATKTIVVLASVETCMNRALQRTKDTTIDWKQLIRIWFDTYQKCESDMQIINHETPLHMVAPGEGDQISFPAWTDNPRSGLAKKCTVFGNIGGTTTGDTIDIS